jgi:hypothetical protein
MEKSIEQFIKEHGITSKAEYGAPYNEDFSQSDPWTVTLRRGKQRMAVPFYMGMGHNGKEPDTATVLDCLASDSSGVENGQDFDGFCSEFGYDTDSRKAEKIYKACERTARRLKQFLGSDLYEELLWNTSRL